MLMAMVVGWFVGWAPKKIAGFALATLVGGCVATPPVATPNYDGVLRGYKNDTVSSFAMYAGIELAGAFDTDEGRVFRFVGVGPTAIYRPATPYFGNISNRQIASGFNRIGSSMAGPAVAVQAQCEVQLSTVRVNNRGNLDSYRITTIYYDGNCGMVRPNRA